MAISRTAASASSGLGNTGTTYTITGFDCAGGDMLIVGAFDDNGDFITSITYNSVAMSKVKVQQTVGRGAGNGTVSMWMLPAPSSGSNNVVITRTTNFGNLGGIAAAYSGASQVSTADATGGVTPGGSFSSLSATATTVADNCAVVGIFMADNGGQAAGSGTTQIVASGGLGLYESSPLVVTPAGPKSLNETNTTGSNGGAAVISFAPAGAVVANNNNLLILDIG